MAYPFVESPNVTKTGGRTIDLIVIHTMEMDEKGDTAEHCALWFRNPAAKVSAHYCVDANSIVQCVRDQDIGWHAPGANHDGIGIEHAGRAKQTGRDWSDAYSVAMLERSAALVADLCKKYSIPVTWLYAADLRAGKRGITTHDAVSKAFKRGSHWDPGHGLPRRAVPGDGAREHGRPRDRTSGGALGDCGAGRTEAEPAGAAARLSRLAREAAAAAAACPRPLPGAGDHRRRLRRDHRGRREGVPASRRPRAGRDRRPADLAGACGVGREAARRGVGDGCSRPRPAPVAT